MMRAVRVVVVSEFYPRASDPVLGIWAHRQAQAVRDAGAEVQVLVLYRPVPSQATLRQGWGSFAREGMRLARQPRRQVLDGVPVTYVPFLSPPRARSYARWGGWAAPPLARALRVLRRSFPFELVHAHNAVPGGDAVRRASPAVPMVVSVHGGDVLYTARRVPGGEAAVRRVLGDARLVLANSAGIERLAREHGARATRVVHLGADVPAEDREGPPNGALTLITVGHLVARKRHADVIRAMALLAGDHPELRYVVVGDGPERDTLARLAAELGVGDRVHLLGQLGPSEALEQLRRASVFVMPSVDEAFGVAYVEAMARGLPAIGCQGEPGPEEIAGAGAGMLLVAPRDPGALARAVSGLVGDPAGLGQLGAQARATVQRAFTWPECGVATLSAYREALER
jgi:glycosyltransferase involved in cell wall biosynthesis